MGSLVIYIECKHFQSRHMSVVTETIFQLNALQNMYPKAAVQTKKGHLDTQIVLDTAAFRHLKIYSVSPFILPSFPILLLSTHLKNA